MARFRKCWVTQNAFVFRVFWAVCIQMRSQMPCSGICVIALLAFMQLFSVVSFQVCPQMACMRGGIFT